MSRAFVKEVEPEEPRCPSCGAAGLVVERATVARHVPESEAERLSYPAWWCPTPRCPIAYFDAWASAVPVAELAHGAPWPKDPAGLLCPCFGIRPEEIEADAEAKDPTRIRDLVRRSETPEARCPELVPSGRCCVPDARRLYLRVSGAGQEQG